VPCPSCGLFYRAGTDKHGYCCGHCMGNRGHGKSCTAASSCESCQGLLERNRGKTIAGIYFHCCGHCSSSAGQRHGQRCVFRRPVISRNVQGNNRSRSPRRDMQGRREVNVAGPASTAESSVSLALCLLCEDAVCNMVCMPCGHFVLCRECSVGCEDRGLTTCMVCRIQCTFHRVFPR